MSSLILRILAYLALALASFAVADGAEAGVFGSALSSFGRSSPAQTVQFGGSNCYYTEGWNGRGWYQCGDQWNDGFGWIGPFNLNTFGGAAVRRHHQHTSAVSHPPAANPVYPRLEPSRRLGAGGAPALRTFGNGPGFRRYGAGGVRTSSNFHAGAATITPGFAGGGFHGGLGGGNFHRFHGAVSPGFAGGGGFHGLGGAGNFHGAGIGVPHIGAPASPGFTGGGGFHGLGGATGVHIGAPASPGFAGIGSFHAGGGVGAPHIGAPASPGFAGGGLHGFGGGGAFQGGGAAFGQGGIGHR